MNSGHVELQTNSENDRICRLFGNTMGSAARRASIWEQGKRYLQGGAAVS